MSFWPSIFEEIKSQRKLIECRRNFPEGCAYAYMYISKPVKAICGIIYFGKRHNIQEWEKKYSSNSEIKKKVKEYLEFNYRYGIEIKAFQEIKPIKLDRLRTDTPKFIAPQSYILLKNNKTLSNYLDNNSILLGDKIENSLLDIFPECILGGS